MPNRHKTRRHGRNLKKLDGLEKRRRTRRRIRQRGGAGALVDSLYSWLDAVKATAAWTRTDPRFTSSAYRIRDIQADVPVFVSTDEVKLGSGQFSLPKELMEVNVRDIRQLAGIVKIILKYIITDDLTAADFAAVIKPYRFDEVTQDRIKFLDKIETAIRRVADSSFTGNVLIDENDKGPLYIWYLFYSNIDDSTPLEDEVEPVLDESAAGRAPAAKSQEPAAQEE